ncbi:MAG: hypothetical protein RIR79_1043 [Pseudomonadota bacterium]|jgi:hypothetical protein
MFGLFKFFFGADDIDTEETKITRNAVSSLDIQAEMTAHENWKMRLKLYLEGQSTEQFSPELVCHDNRCDLGRWIHGTGQEALGKFPGFTTLMRHHQMFHYTASNVVALNLAGQKNEANQILQSQFKDYSNSVMSDLKTLAAVADYAGNK